MEIIRKEYSYPSVTGIADIFARSWTPADGEIKAVLQLVHGMAEYGERYEEMGKAFCEAGYAFIINDHIGHGKSVASKPVYGYFGGDKNKAGKAFVEDAYALTELAKKEFGKPVILMGHSMGSFVARRYITEHADDIKGAIICGTAGPNPALGAGLTLASLIAKIKGEQYPAKLIDKIAFGTYNKRCEGRTPFDWLSVNKANVDKYVADSLCGFLFTASGYKNLFELLGFITAADWYGKVPKMPLLLVAGKEDPVGEYGAGVQKVYDGLKASGQNDIEMKLYDGLRHEIHNEDERFSVYADLIAWCDKCLAK